MNEFIVKGIEQNIIRKINKKQSNNIAKHLRIANSTAGAEREKHLNLAEKLLSRYAPNVDINN